ncbi:hypothetical protein BDZ91DRAFT_190449 [Kalaharituber pfeilii]|nr:hypothetical protein BDZ91DRAFT_190449 [Kalaharituber pfeilii]
MADGLQLHGSGIWRQATAAVNGKCEPIRLKFDGFNSRAEDRQKHVRENLPK